MKLEQRQDRYKKYGPRGVKRNKVTVLLDDDTLAAFQRLADLEQRSDSNMASLLIQEALEAREKGGKDNG